MASVSWISPPAPFCCIEVVEHLRQQDVAADHGKPRWRLGRVGLLHEPPDLDQSAVIADRIQHAVAVGFIGRHLLDRDQIGSGLAERLDHLLKTGLVADGQVIDQQHREGLVADQMTRAPYRMAEAERFRLARS